MRDPLGVWTSGELEVVCQIVHIEHRPRGTLVDIVTLEPCLRGIDPLPAGTPLALGFGTDPTDAARADLESVMTVWEATCALLDLHVDDVPSGLRYHFTCGDRYLTLLVDDQPQHR